jgi:RNA polymerase sigma-70 factor (ECF subfamily)
VAQKNVKALDVLYQKTSYAVFGFALSILKDKAKAEDVMQEVYLKVFEKAHTYSNQQKPMAWILTITKNLCYMEFRKKENQTVSIDSFYTLEQGGNEFKQIEDNIILSKVMKILNEEERQIVVMHAVAGLKHKEIGGLLNLPLSTTLSKYHRAMKKLKGEVEHEK